MRFVLLILVCLFTVSILSSHTYASCGACAANADSMLQEEVVEEGEVVNTICPVMGEKIGKDAPFTSVYEGKTIGFCCPTCIDAFDKAPEKYMEKIEMEEEIAE